MKIFRKKTELSKSGIYAVQGEKLIPLHELPKTGSYNDIAESLGYDKYHSAFIFDSKSIQFIAFKRRTKQPIFVHAKNENIRLSYTDVLREIKNIDWDFENRQLDFQDKNQI